MRSKEFPPCAEEHARYLSESVVIALAGADVEDLSRAKWATIRRGPYMDAAEFLTCHDTSFSDMSLNHSRAQADLQEGGGVVAAVKHLAVPVDVAEKLQHKLEGPADTGGGGCAHEQVAAVDGEDCVSETEEADPGQNAAIADPEFPEEALRAMNFCADSLAGRTSSDQASSCGLET